MSAVVLARLPQVRQLSVPSTLVFLVCHVPPRSHVYHVRKKNNQFHTYIDNSDLAILLNKDPFEPGAVSILITESSTPVCSVHIHNNVAETSDASQALLRRLHAHKIRLNVDFIGGNFHMSAFSTVGDVFHER